MLVVLFHLCAHVGLIFARRVMLIHHSDCLGLIQIKLEVSQGVAQVTSSVLDFCPVILILILLSLDLVKYFLHNNVLS